MANQGRHPSRGPIRLFRNGSGTSRAVPSTWRPTCNPAQSIEHHHADAVKTIAVRRIGRHASTRSPKLPSCHASPPTRCDTATTSRHKRRAASRTTGGIARPEVGSEHRCPGSKPLLVQLFSSLVTVPDESLDSVPGQPLSRRLAPLPGSQAPSALGWAMRTEEDSKALGGWRTVGKGNDQKRLMSPRTMPCRK